jgi:hypothetical protein
MFELRIRTILLGLPGYQFAGYSYARFFLTYSLEVAQYCPSSLEGWVLVKYLYHK